MHLLILRTHFQRWNFWVRRAVAVRVVCTYCSVVSPNLPVQCRWEPCGVSLYTCPKCDLASRIYHHCWLYGWLYRVQDGRGGDTSLPWCLWCWCYWAQGSRWDWPSGSGQEAVAKIGHRAWWGITEAPRSSCWTGDDSLSSRSWKAVIPRETRFTLCDMWAE